MHWHHKQKGALVRRQKKNVTYRFMYARCTRTHSEARHRYAECAHMNHWVTLPLSEGRPSVLGYVTCTVHWAQGTLPFDLNCINMCMNIVIRTLLKEPLCTDVKKRRKKKKKKKRKKKRERWTNLSRTHTAFQHPSVWPFSGPQAVVLDLLWLYNVHIHGHIICFPETAHFHTCFWSTSCWLLFTTCTD